MNVEHRTIDEYLATLEPAQRAALQRLRKAIHAAAPGAEECISYRIPAFRKGKLLVGFGAAKKHCSLYPMSSRTIAKFADELRSFETSRGTIRFTADQPLPLTLVRKLVKARLAENAAEDPSVTPKPKRASSRASVKTQKSRLDPVVDAMLSKRSHPLMHVVQSLRTTILRVAPAVHEEFKWNSPSFRTDEHFATINMSGRGELRLILHAGAKKQHVASARKIEDPEAILEWLGTDRAMIRITDAADLKRKTAPLLKVLRAWIAKA